MRRPSVVVYSTSRRRSAGCGAGAIRFDAPAAGTARAATGSGSARCERRRLREAPVLVPVERRRAATRPGRPPTGRRRSSCPVAVAASGPPAQRRDIAAISYVANPHKKGTDRVLAAWRRRAPAGEELVAGRRRSGRPRRGASASPGASRPIEYRGAAAPRARLRLRAAPRGLRHRAAGGARRRLPAGDDRGARSVRGAGARPRRSIRGSSPPTAPGTRRVPISRGPCAAHSTRSPATTPSAPRRCWRPSPRPPSTSASAGELLPRLRAVA